MNVCNKKKIILYIFIILGIYFFTQKELQNYGTFFCFGDFFVTMQIPVYFSIVIPAIIMNLSGMERKDFSIVRFTRYTSKMVLFLKQELRLVTSAVFISFVFTVGITIFGWFTIKISNISTDILNWGSYDSVFFMKTGVINAKASIIEVLVAFFLISAVRCFFMGNIVLLFAWSRYKTVIGVTVLIGITCVEICNSKIHFIMGGFSAGYRFFTSHTYGIEMIIRGLVYIGILLFLAKRMTVKKELWNETY